MLVAHVRRAFALGVALLALGRGTPATAEEVTADPSPPVVLAHSSAPGTTDDAPLPKSAVQQELEIRNIERRLTELELRVPATRSADERAEDLAELEQSAKAAAPLVNALPQLLSELAAADCKKDLVAAVAALRGAFDNLNDLADTADFSRTDPPQARYPTTSPDPKDCAKLKAFAAQNEGLPRAAQKLFASLQRQVRQLRRTLAQDARDASELARLRQRLDRLRSASTSGSTDVINKLPLLIAFLGIFSLSIMVMVRRYAPDIQREWVQSGQVIQFMTVTVIVIAILSLGLAQKLTPENLGTLLGTIGGYVLAQGIGRSAARKDPDKLQSPRRSPPPATSSPNTTPPLDDAKASAVT